MDFIEIVLFIVLFIAIITDLSYRKIPNALTFPAMFCGVGVHIYSGGWGGLGFSTLGIVTGIGLLFVFYLFGMMGAGDVKLMGAVGSFLGPAGVFQAFLFTALAGGIYAVAVLAVKGQLLRFVKRMVRSLYLSLAQRRPVLLPEEGQALPVLCYGVAIAAGTVTSLFVKF
ncbi:MAG TPA: A24 family peptidase [Syntrophales bacterium]|nr:A24 family peptidase [Syntrophales bacterium]